MIQKVYLFYNSDSTGQSPREANGFPALREILRILWNSGVHHRAHKTQLLISTVDSWIQSHPHISFKVHVNLFPSTLRSSLRPLPFKRSYQTHVHFSSIPRMPHAPHISSTLSWTRNQYCVRSPKMKFIITLFSPKVSYLPTLQPKHFAQHHVLKPPHLDLSCICFIRNFYRHKSQSVYSYIFFSFIIRYNKYLLKLFTSDR